MKSKPVTQIALDGATREFTTFRDSQGTPWLAIAEFDRDKTLVDSKNIKLTGDSRQELIDLLGRA